MSPIARCYSSKTQRTNNARPTLQLICKSRAEGGVNGGFALLHAAWLSDEQGGVVGHLLEVVHGSMRWLRKTEKAVRLRSSTWHMLFNWKLTSSIQTHANTQSGWAVEIDRLVNVEGDVYKFCVHSFAYSCSRIKEFDYLLVHSGPVCTIEATNPQPCIMYSI
jgi:hypothetical protein